MESAVDIVSSLSGKITENPEVEENRCRICYEEAKPLITLCECSGTIAFVHEECILDWITKKMEVSDTVEIPRCEICRATYSARLKIGRKKICLRALAKKVRELRAAELLASLLYLLGTFIAFYLASTMLFALFSLIFAGKQEGAAPQPQENLLVELLTTFVFPFYFLREAVAHGRRRLKLWDESMVQIVELTLNPKLTIKQ